MLDDILNVHVDFVNISRLTANKYFSIVFLVSNKKKTSSVKNSRINLRLNQTDTRFPHNFSSKFTSIWVIILFAQLMECIYTPGKAGKL